MPLFSLTYLSSAAPKFTKVELLEILEESRARNAAARVTGILLYRDGNILQVLEGEIAAVRETYQRIARDPRHSGIFPVIQESITERRFGEWSMAFRDLALDSSGVDGFNDLLNSPHPETSIDLMPSKMRVFLLSFVRQRSACAY